MADFVSFLVAFATDHATLAYLLAFVLAACESLPVIGAIVPGTAAIVALSALVPDGVLGLCPLIVATTLGAVAGDGIAYWIGHRYHETVKDIWPLRRYPGLVDQGVAFFVRHGGKAILIARFTPGVRAVVPLAAGILGMPAVWFYTVNILSAAIWSPTHVGVGVAIGMSLVSLESTRGRLTAIVVAVFAAAWLVLWVTPRLLRRAPPPRMSAKLRDDTGE